MSVRLNINPSTLMANVHFTNNGLTTIIQMAEPAMNFRIKSKVQSACECVNRMKWNKTRHYWGSNCYHSGETTCF